MFDLFSTFYYSIPVFFWFVYLFIFLREEAFIMAERGGEGFRPFRRNGTLSSTLPHQLGILPGQWDHGLRILDRTAHIYLIGVRVCVCICVFDRFCGHTWHREMEKELFRLASLTPGKASFVSICCNSFNCFTSLISSLLTTNSSCSSPQFLMPSLFLSSGRAVRPWGCQRRNKVTGW